MAQIVWTDEARRWLQEIYDYIAENNEEAPYRTVIAIHERAVPRTRDILHVLGQLAFRGNVNYVPYLACP